MKHRTVADVAVVIPCYRCTDTIERSLESVASQTMQPAQVILVDDFSGDGTLELLYELQFRYPKGWLRIIEHVENLGPGQARNTGWNYAKQSYVAFLDADDTWHREKIEIQYQWMREDPGLALTGHDISQVTELSDTSSVGGIDLISATFEPVTKNQLLWSNLFSTPTVMLRRELPMRFEDGKYFSEDYLLWLSIAFSGGNLARCNESLAFMFKAPYGEAGLSSFLWKMQRGQLDSYRTIYRSGHVGFLLYVALIFWSWLRFLRRIAITKLKFFNFST